MKSKKLKLDQIKVDSFITTIDGESIYGKGQNSTIIIDVSIITLSTSSVHTFTLPETIQAP